MKILVIGMDGAHEEAFLRGWTPFIERLIKTGKSAKLKEDLIGRGWLEIVTGEDAKITGALYDKPLMNGTNEWSLKFNLSKIDGYGTKVKPLWQKLNEAGYKVGIMNVPTTNPAPEVNGFFVSGGGGGRKVTQTVSPEQCFPKEIFQKLISKNYIVDERLDSLLVEKKLYNPDGFFSRLCEKNQKRTDCFIDLVKEYNVDFGFMVYKSSSNLAEFGVLPNLEKTKNRQHKKDKRFVDAVRNYYQHVDQEVKRITQEFPEAEIILCSDHGMEFRRHLLNPNIILQKLGYQEPVNASGNLYGVLKKFKHLIPFSWRYNLKRFIGVEKANTVMTPFNNLATQAFSICIGDWRHGIFINDKDRFGGPVSQDAIRSLADKIADEINQNTEFKSAGLKAFTKYGAFSSCDASYPDILFDLPRGFATSTLKQEFIHRVDMGKSALGMAAYTNGKLLAGKSTNALAVTSIGGWQVDESVNDLTLIHKHICRRFGIV